MSTVNILGKNLLISFVLKIYLLVILIFIFFLIFIVLKKRRDFYNGSLFFINPSVGVYTPLLLILLVFYLYSFLGYSFCLQTFNFVLINYFFFYFLFKFLLILLVFNVKNRIHFLHFLSRGKGVRCYFLLTIVFILFIFIFVTFLSLLFIDILDYIFKLSYFLKDCLVVEDICIKYDKPFIFLEQVVKKINYTEEFFKDFLEILKSKSGCEVLVSKSEWLDVFDSFIIIFALYLTIFLILLYSLLKFFISLFTKSSFVLKEVFYATFIINKGVGGFLPWYPLYLVMLYIFLVPFLYSNYLSIDLFNNSLELLGKSFLYFKIKVGVLIGFLYFILFLFNKDCSEVRINLFVLFSIIFFIILLSDKINLLWFKNYFILIFNFNNFPLVSFMYSINIFLLWFVLVPIIRVFTIKYEARWDFYGELGVLFRFLFWVFILFSIIFIIIFVINFKLSMAGFSFKNTSILYFFSYFKVLFNFLTFYFIVYLFYVFFVKVLYLNLVLFFLNSLLFLLYIYYCFTSTHKFRYYFIFLVTLKRWYGKNIQGCPLCGYRNDTGEFCYCGYLNRGSFYTFYYLSIRLFFFKFIRSTVLIPFKFPKTFLILPSSDFLMLCIFLLFLILVFTLLDVLFITLLLLSSLLSCFHFYFKFVVLLFFILFNFRYIYFYLFLFICILVYSIIVYGIFKVCIFFIIYIILYFVVLFKGWAN